MSTQLTSSSSFNWDDYIQCLLEGSTDVAAGSIQGFEETTSSIATAAFTGMATPPYQWDLAREFALLQPKNGS